MDVFEGDRSLTPGRDIDRRRVLTVSLAAGFATAVRPIAAQTAITTDASGLPAKRQKKTCEIIVCPQAGHAFNADYRPSYRPDAAKDGWERMPAWLRTDCVA
jgi:carboxymethylenebutenolidase